MPLKLISANFNNNQSIYTTYFAIGYITYINAGGNNAALPNIEQISYTTYNALFNNPPVGWTVYPKSPSTSAVVTFQPDQNQPITYTYVYFWTNDLKVPGYLSTGIYKYDNYGNVVGFKNKSSGSGVFLPVGFGGYITPTTGNYIVYNGYSGFKIINGTANNIGFKVQATLDTTILYIKPFEGTFSGSFDKLLTPGTSDFYPGQYPVALWAPRTYIYVWYFINGKSPNVGDLPNTVFLVQNFSTNIVDSVVPANSTTITTVGVVSTITLNNITIPSVNPKISLQNNSSANIYYIIKAVIVNNISDADKNAPLPNNYTTVASKASSTSGLNEQTYNNELFVWGQTPNPIYISIIDFNLNILDTWTSTDSTLVVNNINTAGVLTFSFGNVSATPINLSLINNSVTVIYILGSYTTSTDLPTVPPAFDGTYTATVGAYQPPIVGINTNVYDFKYQPGNNVLLYIWRAIAGSPPALGALPDYAALIDSKGNITQKNPTDSTLTSSFNTRSLIVSDSVIGQISVQSTYGVNLFYATSSANESTASTFTAVNNFKTSPLVPVNFSTPAKVNLYSIGTGVYIYNDPAAKNGIYSMLLGGDTGNKYITSIQNDEINSYSYTPPVLTITGPTPITDNSINMRISGTQAIYLLVISGITSLSLPAPPNPIYNYPPNGAGIIKLMPGTTNTVKIATVNNTGLLFWAVPNGLTDTAYLVNQTPSIIGNAIYPGGPPKLVFNNSDLQNWIITNNFVAANKLQFINNINPPQPLELYFDNNYSGSVLPTLDYQSYPTKTNLAPGATQEISIIGNTLVLIWSNTSGPAGYAVLYDSSGTKLDENIGILNVLDKSVDYSRLLKINNSYNTVYVLAVPNSTGDPPQSNFQFNPTSTVAPSNSITIVPTGSEQYSDIYIFTDNTSDTVASYYATFDNYSGTIVAGSASVGGVLLVNFLGNNSVTVSGNNIVQYLTLSNGSTATIYYQILPADGKTVVSSGEGSFTADNLPIGLGNKSAPYKLEDPSVSHIIYSWKGIPQSGGGFTAPNNQAPADYGVLIDSKGNQISSFNGSLKGVVGSVVVGNLIISISDNVASTNPAKNQGLPVWAWILIVIAIIIVIIILVKLFTGGKKNKDSVG